MADPDPMTCDPGSRVYDPNPGTVIPDPIYLVTTLAYSIQNALLSQISHPAEGKFPIQQLDRLQVTKEIKRKQSMYLF